MRWDKKLPINGQTRIITKFLFFPHMIDRRVRWLETVGIEQFYSVHPHDSKGNWIDIRWADFQIVNENNRQTKGGYNG